MARPAAAKKLVSKATALKKSSPKLKLVGKTKAKLVAKAKAKVVAKTKKTDLKLVAKTKMKSLEVGSQAPLFSMPATVLTSVSSATLKGRPYVLYFYPKDKTSGCTAQACGFQEALPQLQKLGIPVVGVSKDTIKSHEAFAKQFNLTFPLASDAETKVCESFGVWAQKSMYGKSYMGIERTTFLIDGEGIIRALWRKVNVPGHIADVQKAINAL